MPEPERVQTCATPLLWALAIAREHGGASSALHATGLAYSDEEAEQENLELAAQLAGLTITEAVGEALALGTIAGRVELLRQVYAGVSPDRVPARCVGARGGSG